MYKTTDFRGKMDDPMMVTSMKGEELFNGLVKVLPEALKKEGIPFNYRIDEVKSGSFFNSSSNQILIISYPDPPTSFFDMGFLVNGNVISFPLLGESKQNTTRNKKNSYLAEGKYIKAALVNPDEFILEQEHAWQAMVMRVFNSIMD